MRLTQQLGEDRAAITPPAKTSPIAEPALIASIRKHRTGTTPFDLSVDLELPRGITILFGASGAGKTTILDCIAGLTLPDSGKIAVSSRILFDSSQSVNIAVPQRGIGYVFQDLALFPHLTVQANVEYGLQH